MPSNYKRKSSSQRKEEKRAKKRSKERSKKERTYKVDRLRTELRRDNPFFYDIIGGYNRAADEGLLLGPVNDEAYRVAAAEASSPLSFEPSPMSSPMSSQMSSPLSSTFSSPSAAPDNSRLLRVPSFASDVGKYDRYIPDSWKKYNSSPYSVESPFSSP